MKRAVALLARVDRGWARGEGWLAVALLLAMVLVGSWAALLQVLARADLRWTHSLPLPLDRCESFLQGSTFWLAFLGASLAAHQQQHIAVDLLRRRAPPRAKLQLRAIASFAGALFTAGLAIAFWSGCMIALSERKLVEYELILPEQQQVHICDATDAQLALGHVERPVLFCSLRALLRTLSLPSETPEAAFLLIAPLMLAVIALRLFGQGMRSAATMERGELESAGEEPP
jgi:TRAP-type C4-dicarboxylate transport system permease small subunit